MFLNLSYILKSSFQHRPADLYMVSTFIHQAFILCKQKTTVFIFTNYFLLICNASEPSNFIHVFLNDFEADITG